MGWNQTAITSQTSGSFRVADVGVNAVYASGWGVLADLAEEAALDEQLARSCREHQLKAESAVMQLMYDTSLGQFVSLYKVGMQGRDAG
jgi:GH15 family glucan-1,4-alpha-glucosidase